MTESMRPDRQAGEGRKWRRNLVLVVFAGLLFIYLKSLMSPPSKVVLTNVSAQTMRSVTVHVSGKSYDIGDLMPGVPTSVEVRPEGDSHVELSFDGNRRLKIDCYTAADSGDIVTATVTPQTVITVETRPPPTVY